MSQKFRRMVALGVLCVGFAVGLAWKVDQWHTGWGCDSHQCAVEGEILGERWLGGGCPISRAMRSAACPPAFGLLLYLRRAHHPTDSTRLLVGWQGKTGTAWS